MKVQYSIVIPLKDEVENITPLVEELESVMDTLNTQWELICIDDGSTDGTAETLNQLARKRPNMRILTFDSNYGQTSAFDAGFKAAEGEYVITMDGDRQNDPNDIPKLLELAKDYDLICGIRVKRRDTWFKRNISKIANWIRSRVCRDGMEDTGCSLKVYRTDCLRQIKLFNGMHRFLPALFIIEGFTASQIPVNHRERWKGQTKYNIFNRSLNTVSDMFAVVWMRRRHLKYKLR